MELDIFTCSDDEFFNQMIQLLKWARNAKQVSTMDNVITLRIDDVDVQVGLIINSKLYPTDQTNSKH